MACVEATIARPACSFTVSGASTAGHEIKTFSLKPLDLLKPAISRGQKAQHPNGELSQSGDHILDALDRSVRSRDFKPMTDKASFFAAERFTHLPNVLALAIELYMSECTQCLEACRFRRGATHQTKMPPTGNCRRGRNHSISW